MFYVAPEQSNIITVSVIDANEVKKEDYNYSFQTTDLNIIENENNDCEDSTGNSMKEKLNCYV